MGSDADVVIFDPEREQVRSAATQATRCDYNLFEGMRIKGAVDTVLSRGKVVVDGGKYVGVARRRAVPQARQVRHRLNITRESWPRLARMNTNQA